MCYPIFVDEKLSKIIDVGYAPASSTPVAEVNFNNGLTAVWPMTLGREGRWQLGREAVINGLKDGTVRLGSKQKDGHWTVQYLNAGALKEIKEGSLVVKGRDKNNALIIERIASKLSPAKSVWNQSSHDASANGSGFLLKVFNDKKFAFPKSIYSTHDAIKYYVQNKPNAIIVDFFAGSGTTLHAVNLLNAEAGGHRRCIMVTNNEVSDDEAKSLSAQGYHPGDTEWEKLGIAQYVTWPRTVCSIEGHDVNGNPLKGNYLGSDLPMADGFEANAAFFKLGFLDKTSVALGKQFKELLSILWMKAGAIGKCPEIDGDAIPEMLVLPKNKFAVLADERHYLEFVSALDENPGIETVFIITDSEAGYRDMIIGMEDKNTHQLYRDYLDNFRINSVRR